METTLHQQLKRCYAPDEASTEVVVGRYRIDAVREDELVEVQCASLSAIRDKCRHLLDRHRLRVVKPVTIRTRIAKVKRKGGKIVSRRMSPSRGNVLELFEDLIYFTRVFPHKNLTLEVPLVHVQQVRGPAKRRRRWHKGYAVHDVSLEFIESTIEFRQASDLMHLIPLEDPSAEFDTAQIARVTELPRWKAQQIAYVLRKTGAIEPTGRTRSGITYRSSEARDKPGNETPDAGESSRGKAA